MARSTLDFSPPEATSARGARGNPGFAENRKFTLSAPLIVASHSSKSI